MPNLYLDSEETVQPKPTVPDSTTAVAATPPPPPEVVTPGQVELKANEPHIFTCFHENPEGIHFQNQEADEKIILFLRHHYITTLGWQIATLLLLIAPLGALALFPYLNITLPIPLRYIVILGIFYYLIIFGFAFVNFVIWFYNVGLVTNRRVIDIDVDSINSKDVAATALSDIIDIAYNQKGFQQTIFDFGDVYMETQATKPNFEFLQVPHPSRVTDIISSMIVRRSHR
ncbi:MAG TPA: hypothetical protein VG935_01175 [Patescibacteria group bacterium]|nr:hypothetical protein [Patescibacteria group bacterium]